MYSWWVIRWESSHHMNARSFGTSLRLLVNYVLSTNSGTLWILAFFQSTPLVESPVIRVFKIFDEGYDDLKVPSFMQTLSQVDAELLTYSNYSVSNEACFQLICFP